MANTLGSDCKKATDLFCDTCDCKIDSADRLWHCAKDHMDYHVCFQCFPPLEKNIFRCCFCKRKFGSKDELQRHFMGQLLCAYIIREFTQQEWNSILLFCRPPNLSVK